MMGRDGLLKATELALLNAKGLLCGTIKRPLPCALYRQKWSRGTRMYIRIRPLKSRKLALLKVTSAKRSMD